MKRSKFTEEQIIGILREQEAGAKTAEVCRRHGISGATFYAWKAKFGGMEPSEAKRLKALEEENAKLKRLLAEAMLDNTALKDLLRISEIPDSDFTNSFALNNTHVIDFAMKQGGFSGYGLQGFV